MAKESWNYSTTFARVDGNPFKAQDPEQHERQYARRFSDQTRVADALGDPTINNGRVNPQQLLLTVDDMRALLGETPSSAGLRLKISARLEHVEQIHDARTDETLARLLYDRMSRTRKLLRRLTDSQ